MKDNHNNLDCFWNKVENRRSIYDLGSKEIVSQDEIIKVINQAVLHTPTSFNAQTGRVVVLFGAHYHRLWAIVREELHKVVPIEQFAPTEAKIASFDKGYGTVLFFEDEFVTKGLQEKFSLYADNFPKWSLQSSGMLQYVVWTGLEALGLGASLQHYNPLIDAAVAQEWSIPSSWKLISQMPFGSVEASAGEKSFLPLEKRVKVFK